MTLRDVCRAAGGGVVGPDGKGDGPEVKDGCLSLVVVPKGDVERKCSERALRITRDPDPNLDDHRLPIICLPICGVSG